MKVSDIMSDLIVAVPPSASAGIARSVMKSAHIHHLMVMDGRTLVGVLSERDLGRPDDVDDRTRTVRQLMTTDFISVTPDTPVRRAANILRGHSIGSLPILEGDRLVGVVTVSDMLELVGRSEMLGKNQRRTSWRKGPRPKSANPVVGRF